MLGDELFIVLFCLALEGFGDGDDSVQVVLSTFEVVSFQVLVSVVRSALVVLEPSLVLFLGVVVGHVYAR